MPARFVRRAPGAVGRCRTEPPGLTLAQGAFPRSRDRRFILFNLRSPDIRTVRRAAVLSRRRNTPAHDTKSQLTQEDSPIEHHPLCPLLRPADRLGRIIGGAALGPA